MNWPQEEYEKQRKNRLEDAIAEYLEDESISALTLYNDIGDVLKSWADYHKKHLENVGLGIELICKGMSPRVDENVVQSSMEHSDSGKKRWYER